WSSDVCSSDLDVIAADIAAVIDNRDGSVGHLSAATAGVLGFSEFLAPVINNVDAGNQGGVDQGFGDSLDLLEVVGKYRFQQRGVRQLDHGLAVVFKFFL